MLPMPIRIAIGKCGRSGCDMLEHGQEEIDRRSMPVRRGMTFTFRSVMFWGVMFRSVRKIAGVNVIGALVIQEVVKIMRQVGAQLSQRRTDVEKGPDEGPFDRLLTRFGHRMIVPFR